MPTIKDHPVVVFLAACVVSFGLGWAAVHAVDLRANQKPVPVARIERLQRDSSQRLVSDSVIIALRDSLQEVRRPRPTGASQNPAEIVWWARDVVRSTGVQLTGSGYGADMVQNGPPFQNKLNELVYAVRPAEAGQYRLEALVASNQPRPCEVLLNGQQIIAAAFGGVTGSYHQSHAQWMIAGSLHLAAGDNEITIRHPTAIPHFAKLRFVRVGA